MLTLASKQQRDWFLDPIASGEKTVCYAITEAAGLKADIAYDARAVRLSGAKID